jgi:hypothetical protein
MHAHTHPSLFRRGVDDLGLANHALDFGMRGFVLKDHDSSTTGRAHHVRSAHRNLDCLGAIALNRTVGGLDPYVVQGALHYGARVVWMPSNHSKWHADSLGTPDYPQQARIRRQLDGQGLTVLDEHGELTKNVLTILDLIAEDDACLATGHLSLDEIRALLDAANERGVSKFLVTHANWAFTKLDLSVQKELIQKGAYIEYAAVTCVSPIFWEQNPTELASWIQELRGDHLVLSSDLGHPSSPPHPEGVRMLLSALLDAGAGYDDLEKMTKANPATLLGLST